MFGLPTSTALIIFGIPAIWVIYTLVFVFRSRHWKAEDVEETTTASATAALHPEAGGRS